MESERVTWSIVGTNAALFPKVKFWKILCGLVVSGCHKMDSFGDLAYPLDAVNLVIFAYAFTSAGTEALWKHSS